MFRPVNKIGVIGENIAVMFLMKQGFSIIGRNFWKKWGEIDIIAKKGDKTYFVEVKSVSCENISDIDLKQGTGYRPEDNLHKNKLARLCRTIATYCEEKNVDGEWQIDAIIVYVDEKQKKSKVKVISNIIIE